MFYLEYATTTALRMLLDVPATLLHTGAVGTDWTGHVATRRRWEGQKYPKVGYFAENAAQTDRGTSSRNSLRRQGQRGEGESPSSCAAASSRAALTLSATVDEMVLTC